MRQSFKRQAVGPLSIVKSRDLTPSAIRIFGNRSEHGAHSLAVNLSLIHTAKCLHRELIPLLKIALLSGSVAAADFLFENSS